MGERKMNHRAVEERPPVSLSKTRAPLNTIKCSPYLRMELAALVAFINSFKSGPFIYSETRVGRSKHASSEAS